MVLRAPGWTKLPFSKILQLARAEGSCRANPPAYKELGTPDTAHPPSEEDPLGITKSQAEATGDSTVKRQKQCKATCIFLAPECGGISLHQTCWVAANLS